MRREGSHSLPVTHRPEVVEEFDSPAFHAALRPTVRKWRPALAQLEFTQMAQYAPDCAPAPTILVEHDITFDLYEQLLAHRGSPGIAPPGRPVAELRNRRLARRDPRRRRCPGRMPAW